MKNRTDAVENAWKLHDAQLDWTAKADAKAAFAFGLDSAALAGIIALIAANHVFFHFQHWWLIALFLLAAALLLAGAVFSALGVAPRLRSRKAKEEASDNHIYFGHVRHWSARDLESSLRSDDLLAQLSRNIVQSGKISWKKHVAVTWSIWFTMASGVLFVAYVLLSRLP